MVFTRILALYHLSPAYYYLYVLLYNIVYVIPLVIIVTISTMSLGRMKLIEWQGRTLKLVSGNMIFLLGLILLTKPDLMDNILSAIGLVLVVVVGSYVIILLTKYYERKQK